MNKFAKPAKVGVALAMSFLALSGVFAPAANALGLIIFTPPPKEDKLAEIKNHDIIVFIDSSKSMSRSVGPDARFCATDIVAEGIQSAEGKSRWQWCSEQTDKLSKQLKVMKDQLKVVVFSQTYKVYKDVDLTSVPGFFAGNKPGGMTNATVALRSQLKNYFANRDAHKGDGRPLLVAVITDGAPDDPKSLRQVIVDATRQMHRPDEVAITFLQVGIDPKATEYLRDLDNNLVKDNARYDIVSSKSFEEVDKAGLAASLIDAVHRENTENGENSGPIASVSQAQ